MSALSAARQEGYEAGAIAERQALKARFWAIESKVIDFVTTADGHAQIAGRHLINDLQNAERLLWGEGREFSVDAEMAALRDRLRAVEAERDCNRARALSAEALWATAEKLRSEAVAMNVTLGRMLDATQNDLGEARARAEKAEADSASLSARFTMAQHRMQRAEAEALNARKAWAAASERADAQWNEAIEAAADRFHPESNALITHRLAHLCISSLKRPQGQGAEILSRVASSAGPTARSSDGSDPIAEPSSPVPWTPCPGCGHNPGNHTLAPYCVVCYAACDGVPVPSPAELRDQALAEAEAKLIALRDKCGRVADEYENRREHGFTVHGARREEQGLKNAVETVSALRSQPPTAWIRAEEAAKQLAEAMAKGDRLTRILDDLEVIGHLKLIPPGNEANWGASVWAHPYGNAESLTAEGAILALAEKLRSRDSAAASVAEGGGGA